MPALPNQHGVAMTLHRPQAPGTIFRPLSHICHEPASELALELQPVPAGAKASALGLAGGETSRLACVHYVSQRCISVDT